MKRSLEAIKKICKKYRYMFRSDDLYREMNYMIENLSPILLGSLIVSTAYLNENCRAHFPAKLNFFFPVLVCSDNSAVELGCQWA